MSSWPASFLLSRPLLVRRIMHMHTAHAHASCGRDSSRSSVCSKTIGYVLGRITLPRSPPIPWWSPPHPQDLPCQCRRLPDRAAGTPEGVQQRKVAKKELSSASYVSPGCLLCCIPSQ